MRYSDFTTLTRQVSLPAPTEADLAIAGAARGLLENCWTGSPLRLLGVGVSGLEDASQLDLFARRVDRDTRVDHMLDQLHGRFGHSAPRRGAATTLRDLDFRGDDLRGLGQHSADEG